MSSNNYTTNEYLKRILWILTFPFFRFSPRHFYLWRTFLLRLFGAKIGKNVRIFPSSRIMFPWELRIGDNVVISWNVTVYDLGRLTIGKDVVVSQGVHLCGGTHDYTGKDFYIIKSKIDIEDGVWIAADAFIGPDVVIGKECVIGARSVVLQSTEPYGVYTGNPARLIKNKTSSN
jgi:putative colanic acid biosynthesis acetyltransferase WcaF